MSFAFMSFNIIDNDEDCEKQGLSILHAASASFRNESTVLFNEVPSLGLL